MRHRYPVNRFKVAVVLLCGLVIGLSSFAYANDERANSGSMSVSMPGMKMMPPATPLSGMSIYNLASPWTTQDGASAELSSLRGSYVVAAMIYTRCKDVCPVTTERMQEIEHSLPKRLQGKVKFVLFSMDWKRDTPEQLRVFAAQHHLDPHHWLLFHGDEAAVRELAAALGISFHREDNGDFQHSIAVFLLDVDGVVAAEEGDLQKAPTTIGLELRRLLQGGRPH